MEKSRIFDMCKMYHNEHLVVAEVKNAKKKWWRYVNRHYEGAPNGQSETV